MSVFESVIRLIAPPDCVICGDEGATLCEACQTAEIVPYGERCYLCGALSPLARTCQSCRKHSPTHVWLTSSYEGAAQQLLQAYKFKHQRRAARDLSRLMCETLRLYQDELSNYLVVPVATASGRIRERGFDHSALLARSIAAELGLEYEPLLGRLGQARQVGSKRAQRISQQAGAYYALHPNRTRGRKVLLVDDVVTTGATLRAASKTLRAAGAARVDALVFAKRI